jgi:hypothetical protein
MLVLLYSIYSQLLSVSGDLPSIRVLRIWRPSLHLRPTYLETFPTSASYVSGDLPYICVLRIWRPSLHPRPRITHTFLTPQLTWTPEVFGGFHILTVMSMKMTDLWDYKAQHSRKQSTWSVCRRKWLLCTEENVYVLYTFKQNTCYEWQYEICTENKHNLYENTCLWKYEWCVACYKE